MLRCFEFLELRLLLLQELPILLLQSFLQLVCLPLLPCLQVFEIEDVQYQQNLLKVAGELPSNLVHPFALGDVIFVLRAAAGIPGCHKRTTEFGEQRKEMLELEVSEDLPRLWVSKF